MFEEGKPGCVSIDDGEASPQAQCAGPVRAQRLEMFEVMML